MCQYSSSINKAGLENKHPNLLCTHLCRLSTEGVAAACGEARSALQGCPACSQPWELLLPWLGGLGCVSSIWHEMFAEYWLLHTISELSAEAWCVRGRSCQRCQNDEAGSVVVPRLGRGHWPGFGTVNISCISQEMLQQL